ncbi:ataxin-10 isoform X1 [Paramormyrops kingsleyae]|uniref:ataxin-10 isoform X1 n=1 Tax=Paramormyrops kingsleyae TaxID=1676925 RepID=UPI003B96F0D6
MAAPAENVMDFSVKLNEVNNEDFDDRHLYILQSLTKAFREPEFRCCVEKDVLRTMMEVLSKLFEEIRILNQQELASELGCLCLHLTAECFRSQRNACVQCSRNQTLMRDLGFIKVSLSHLSMLLKLQLENADRQFEAALRCGVQFLGNLAVGNQTCKDDIWMDSFPHLFLELLDHSDEKTAAYSAMVLYTCLDPNKVEEMVTHQEHQAVARKVIALCQKQPELDWAVLIVTQHFLKSPELTEKMFAELSCPERVTLLELIAAQLGEPEEPQEPVILPKLAQFLVTYFVDHCKAVLELASGPFPADTDALTVTRLLDVLCEMTSDRKLFMFLQDHPTLLSSTVELLKEVHFLGKAGHNVFSTMQDFSTASSASHPAVGFKAHLVRLIGNLCHINAENQNKVRELDGIPLILDNCSIDSNNPFISQWAVFAIRILLENNQENQAVVQALERRGVASDSALRDMGFRLEERDGRLLLKPIRKEP